MKQDHVFFSISTVEGKLASVAARRTDAQANLIAGAECSQRVAGPSAVSIADAVEAIRRKVIEGRSEKYVVVYHFESSRNVFVRACQDAGVDSPFGISRVWVDVAQVAWPMMAAGAISSRTLDALAKYLSARCPSKRDATQDCAVLSDVYWKMMQRYSQAQWVESKIDEAKTAVQSTVFGMVDALLGRGGVVEPPAPGTVIDVQAEPVEDEGGAEAMQ